MGLSGTGQRDDVRLQEAGEDPREEEERRGHGSQREADPGESGQPVRGEFPAGALIQTDKPKLVLQLQQVGVSSDGDVLMKIFKHLSMFLHSFVTSLTVRFYLEDKHLTECLNESQPASTSCSNVLQSRSRGRRHTRQQPSMMLSNTDDSNQGLSVSLIHVHFLSPGEPGVCVRDQARPVHGPDHDERRRPEVS